jgi:PhzF family phenazine biosynthesis protein
MTTTVPLFWVDAFSAVPYAGNPAAVCLLDHGPPDTVLQSLAGELGLSETAYVRAAPTAPGAAARFDLRWFTPTTEVDLCGHATLAAAHVLWEDGRVAPGRAIEFSTRSGDLRATRAGSVIELDLPAQPPSPVAIAAPLRSWLPGVLRAARAGRSLLVELETDAAVGAVSVDQARLAELDDLIVIVTARGETGPWDYVVRVFAPRLGIDEDPVTGSAQCVAGPYWAERLGRRRLRCRQLSARGGELVVSVLEGRVGVAGEAVTVLRGEVALEG